MPDQLTTTAAVHSTVHSSAGELAALIGSPAGNPPASPVILLVPGYTGSKEDFAPLLDPLAAKGFVAIAIDLPGQYESPGPADEAAYTPHALGPILASVVSRLASARQVVLLGHSFGGLVAREAVLTGAPVSGLVLLCSGPAAFVSGNRFDALTRTRPVLRAMGKQALYDAGQLAAGLDPADPAPLPQFLRRRFLASSEPGLLGMGGALLTEPDRTGELAATMTAAGVKTAVIAGEADDAWPLQVQADMASTLGTELLLVPGAAHSPAVEAPHALLEILVPLIRVWLSAG